MGFGGADENVLDLKHDDDCNTCECISLARLEFTSFPFAENKLLLGYSYYFSMRFNSNFTS